MPPFLCFLLAVSLLKVVPKGQCGQAVCVPKHRQVVRCLMEKMHLLDELCSGWSSGAIGHKPQMTIVDCVCLSPLGAFFLLGLFLILISVTCPIDCYIKEIVEFLKRRLSPRTSPDTAPPTNILLHPVPARALPGPRSPV